MICWIVFQSTPPARGATAAVPAFLLRTAISIHAPREGGDIDRRFKEARETEFQSTPPARGATATTAFVFFAICDFNPRPPRGGRPAAGGADPGAERISIHAPREGGDSIHFCRFAKLILISIHAPREGGDLICPPLIAAVSNFNPRPPRGGRHLCRDLLVRPELHFNPRPPRGGQQQRCTVLPVDL